MVDKCKIKILKDKSTGYVFSMNEACKPLVNDIVKDLPKRKREYLERRIKY